MLVAFANQADLSRYAQAYCDYAESSVTFHAFTEGEGRPIYAIAFQKKKVEAVEDWRTFDDLRHRFPRVGEELIERVWNNQHDWNACFDVLSSIIASHGYAAIDDCETIFDTNAWPQLPSTRMTVPSIITMATHNNNNQQTEAPTDMSLTNDDNSVAGSEWTVVSLAGFVPGSPHQHEGISSRRTSLSEDGHDWSLVEAMSNHTNHSLMENNNIKITDMKLAVKLSYKEIMLKSLAHGSNAVNPRAIVPVKSSHNKPWKPIIFVTTVPKKRADREYVDYYSNKISEIIDEEEETRRRQEEEYYWDVCCAGTGYYGLPLSFRKPNKSRRFITNTTTTGKEQRQTTAVASSVTEEVTSLTTMAAIANANRDESSVGYLVPLFNKHAHIS